MGLDAELLADLVQQVERLDLARAERRHAGHRGRGLDEGARVLGGEVALLEGEHGQGVGRGRAALLLADAAAVVIAVEHLQEVRAARQDLVVDRDRADHLADAARLRRARAQERGYIAAVGVEPERAARARFRARGARKIEARVRLERLAHGAEGADLVAHLADQLAVGVLIARGPEVGADAPEDPAQVVLVVARDRQPTQAHEAAAVLDLAADLGQRRGEMGQREVGAGDLAPGKPARLDAAERRVDLVQRALGQRPDPVTFGKLGAAPGEGPDDRPPHRRCLLRAGGAGRIAHDRTRVLSGS